MHSSGNELSADQVLSFFAEQERVETGDPVPAEQVQAYREAAAVLAAVADPDHLRPIGLAEGVSLGDAAHVLGADLIHASGQKFEGKVMLAPVVRREIIRDLATSGRIEEALAANPEERTGPLQEQLEMYLQGSARSLDEQSLDELDETHQVVVWLGDAIEGVPTEQEVIDRGAYLRLLAPFETIAGDRVFRGRRKELDQLRRYVGVLPPESLLARLKEAALRWTRPERQPALSISGPGGVGKSALVARFMLEHTKIEEEARIPFAYLDFDRASLDVGNPLGLCGEMIRQLDCQFPGGDRFSRLRMFADDPRRQPESIPVEDQLSAAQSLLADLLGVIETVLGPRPYVVVLDTFEELQYRGESRAFPLWDLLNELQERAPFLRVVISGRAPVESLRLAGQAPNQIVLGDLDTEAAVAFLEAEGVGDRELAGELVGSFGGVPLTLKLVASLATKSVEDLTESDATSGRGGLLVSVSDEVIQGQLYERILDHIRDEQVRRLAHPGLVLRRINPQVILEVLNGPCDLGITTLQEAQALFEGLQREVSLVTFDELDESLVHRADLRRVMLKLLIQSEPDRVERIRKAAVEYYQRQPGRRGKAEEIYHRLHLGWSVDERELSDREVRSSIQASVVELPIDVQLWLSTLGFQVPDEVRQRGTQDQQDASLASEIEELLPYGPSSVAEAARIVSETTASLDRPSPLFRAAARVMQQQGDTDGARLWIERGLERSVTAGLTLLTLGLLQEQAWLQRDGEAGERAETLDRLADYANRHRHREALLQHRLQSLDLQDDRLDRRLSALDDLLLQVDPTEIWGLAQAFGPAVAASLEMGGGIVLKRLQDLVLDEKGPFRYAAFPDQVAQAMLESLLVATGTPDPVDAVLFGKAFLDLTNVWPYRVLFVQPTFGRSGERLAESLS